MVGVLLALLLNEEEEKKKKLAQAQKNGEANSGTPRADPILTNCARCGKPLFGPQCGYCKFDHRKEELRLLCFVPPHKLYETKKQGK